MILNAVGRSRKRSKIDLSEAYFQTRVDPKDVDQYCFKSLSGCLVSKVMHQGDINAPGAFRRVISDLLAAYIRH